MTGVIKHLTYQQYRQLILNGPQNPEERQLTREIGVIMSIPIQWDKRLIAEAERLGKEPPLLAVWDEC